MTASYRKTLPPYIRSADSLAKRSWGQVLALVPVFIASCFTGHAEILRVLLVCLVSATAFEFLAAKILKKKENLKSGPNTNQSKQSGDWGRPNYHESKESNSWGGETVLAAALFTLLMPSRCPSEILVLGVFIMIVAGKELLGGTGSYPLHPVLLSRVFLQISFPKLMTEPMLFSGNGSFWALAAIALGGIMMLKEKRGYWESPVLFIAICFLGQRLSGSGETTASFFSGVLLTAFFLLADPAAMPLTRKGARVFVAGAAILSSGLHPGGFSIRTAGYAILLMNLLTPWLDLWIKPNPYKAPQTLKATYRTKA